MAKYDGTLRFDTLINKEGFDKGLNSLKSAGVKAGKAIAASLVAAGTSLVGMGAYATTASIEFESAFAGVRKVLDGTEEQFAALNKGIRDLSKELPQSAADIAGVAEAAGQLGIGTEDVLDFTRTMVMLGDATDLSSEEAATSLARLSAITGMSADDYDRLGSSIVGLGNNFATTESEVVEMSLRLAGTGNQIGLSEHAILGMSAAMSSVGINAQAGGSAMSRVMQKMNTEVLSGGAELESFASIAGMSADQFTKTWQNKPQDAIVSFVKGLGDIKDSGGDVTTTLKEMGINSLVEVDTLLRLSGASNQLTDALDISATSWEENSALIEEANERYKTTESQLKILKNNVDSLAISVGDELKESLVGVIGTATEMVDKLSTAFEEGGFQGLVGALGEVFADVFVLFAESIPMFLDNATNMILSFVTGIQENLPRVIESAMNIVDSLLDVVIELLPAFLDLGMDILLGLINGIIEKLPDLMAMGVELIVILIEKIVEKFPDIIATAIKLIAALIIGLIQAIPSLVAAIPRIVLAIVNGLLEFDYIGLGVDLIVMIGKGILNTVGYIVEQAGSVAKSIIRAIVNIFVGEAEGVGSDLVKGIWNGIDNVTGWILDKIKGFGSSIMKGIKGIFGIKSPSTIMRDQIGKNLILGIGVGIEKEIPKLQRDINSEMGKLTAGMKATVELETRNNVRAMTGSSGRSSGSEIITNNNDNGVVQNVTIVSPQGTPSENARQMKKIQKEIAYGY